MLTVPARPKAARQETLRSAKVTRTREKCPSDICIQRKILKEIPIGSLHIFSLHSSNTHLLPFLIPTILRNSNFQIFASQGLLL